MPIVGLNLKSIKANISERKIMGSVDVNSTPVIKKVEKKDTNMPGMKAIVSIDFSFSTKYDMEDKKSGKKVDIGEISFEGEVLYFSEDIREVLKKWEKDKKMDDKLTLEILNAIFRRCLTKGIDLSAELGLPPPIRFPIVKPKQQDEYIG